MIPYKEMHILWDEDQLRIQEGAVLLAQQKRVVNGSEFEVNSIMVLKIRRPTILTPALANPTVTLTRS